MPHHYKINVFPSSHTADQEDVIQEIQQRLDRIEQAIVMLAGGDDNNGNGNEDPATRPNSLKDRNARSQRLFGADDLIVKGNLSSVGREVYQPGRRYPDDKSETAQSFRDKFMSRNPPDPRVANINAINRRRYG